MVRPIHGQICRISVQDGSIREMSRPDPRRVRVLARRFLGFPGADHRRSHQIANGVVLLMSYARKGRAEFAGQRGAGRATDRPPGQCPRRWAQSPAPSDCLRTDCVDPRALAAVKLITSTAVQSWRATECGRLPNNALLTRRIETPTDDSCPVPGAPRRKPSSTTTPTAIIELADSPRRSTLPASCAVRFPHAPGFGTRGEMRARVAAPPPNAELVAAERSQDTVAGDRRKWGFAHTAHSLIRLPETYGQVRTPPLQSL